MMQLALVTYYVTQCWLCFLASPSTCSPARAVLIYTLEDDSFERRKQKKVSPSSDNNTALQSNVTTYLLVLNIFSTSTFDNLDDEAFEFVDFPVLFTQRENARILLPFVNG